MSWNSKFNVPSFKTKSFTLLRQTDVLLNFLLFLSMYCLCCVSCFCLFLSKFGTGRFRFPGFDSILVFIRAYLSSHHSETKLSILHLFKNFNVVLRDSGQRPRTYFLQQVDLGCVFYIGFISAEKRLFNSLPFLASGLTCLFYLYHNFQLPTLTHCINLIA